MSSLNKSFIQNVVRVAVRLLTSAVLGLVLASLLARILGPVGNGIYSLAILLPTVAVMFGNLGLSSAVVYLVSKDITRVKAIVINLFVCSILLGLVTLMVVNGLLKFVFHKWASQIPTDALTIALLAIPVLMLYTNMVTAFQGLQHFKTLGLLLVAPVAITLTLTSFGLQNSNERVDAAVFFWASGYTVALALTLYQLYRFVRPSSADLRVNIKILAESFSYGFMAYLGNLITFANYRISYYLIASFVGLKELGIFSATIPLTEGIWLLSNAVSSVVFPMIAGSSGESRYKNYTPTISAAVFLVTTLAAIALAILATPVVSLLFGSEYESAALILKILLPGVAVFSIAKVLSNDIAGRGRPGVNLLITAASLAVNLALNALLIPLLKLEGAALASSLTLTFYTAVTLVTYSKLTKTTISSSIFLTSEALLSILRATGKKLS